MKVHPYFLVLTILAALVLVLPSHSQIAMAPMKRVITPDTPPNRHLLKAVEEGNLADVQAALREGASADMQAGWEGQPEMVPVALLAGQPTSASLLAGQTEADRRKKVLPIFRLLIQNISKSSAADPKIGAVLLSAAVRMDDLDSVQRLVTLGSPVNARSYHGMGILDESIEQNVQATSGVSPITAFLLDHGAPVNAQDDDQKTPLMTAAWEDKADVVRALLAHGADPTLRDKHGWTALRLAGMRGWDDAVSLLRDRSPMEIGEAAQFGDVPRLRAHLDAGENPNAPDAQGTTPLMAAMQSGSLAAARLLLDRGANVNAKRKNGATALHLAALYGDTALIGLLLDRGANINAVAGPAQATPLLYAMRQVQVPAVALLLKRGMNVKQGQGEAALAAAIRDAGNGFVRPPVGVSWSHALRGDAVYDAREQIIDLLLGAGVDIRAKSSHALYLAASHGQFGLIELFLSKGAAVNGRGAVGPVGGLDDGKTALMGAIEAWSDAYSDEEMMTNGTMSGPDIKDVHEAEQVAQKSVVLLLAHGADVNLPDARGTTPLMQCTIDGLPTCAKLLLAHGAKVDQSGPAGRTALMQAACDDNHALVALLLAHHANVNHQDTQGRTALMLAIDDGSNDEYRTRRTDEDEMPSRFSDEPTKPISQKDLPNPDGHPQTVRLLLQHGANVNAVALNGTTALSLVRKQKFGVVAALLTQAGARR